MKFILCVLLLCCFQSVTPLFCYWNTGCPYRFFSSKTPYNMLRGDIRDSLVKLTDCQPVSIWALLRHGKTNPDVEYGRSMKATLSIVDDIVSSHQNGSSSLCAQDVENLRNWLPDKNIFDKVNQLSEEGYQESLGIGRRLKQAFPKLLSQLGKEDYTFRPVKGPLTEDSIKGLVEGLGYKTAVIESPKADNDNIAPYKTCDKYLRDVQNSTTTHLEGDKYLANSEFLALKDRLRRRLGINHSVSDDTVLAIWNLCRFTSNGITNKFSPWCALFTSDDLRVLEYSEDLRRYYRNGYGTSMNKIFGEIALAELLKSFRSVKEGHGKKITGYISHSSMLNMVYTAMGLFKDANPLTSAERKADRQWRTSKFSIFSNNLIAVLNKCEKEEDNYNVVFYLNEEPVRTVCKDGVCSWKEFEDKMSPFLESNTEFC